MHRWVCGALVVLAAGTGAIWPAICEAEDSGQLVAIQQRKYIMAHEIELAASIAPLDAFDKGLGGEAAYTIHFNDAIGWEVLRAGYYYQLDTGLKSQLLQEFGVVPTSFQTLQYFGSTALEWSPAYGKLAWNNAAISHIEFFLTLGAAIGQFTSSIGYGPELGVGLRVYINQVLSWRTEIRDAYFFERDAQNVLFVSTGLSFNIGGKD